MSKKKGKLTQMQINGITCIAVILVATLLIVFFYKKPSSEPIYHDSIQAQNSDILKNKEDSVYHSRHRKNNEHSSPNTHHSSFNTQHFYTSNTPAPTRRPLVVNLNDADTTTLMLLHGIGPTFARRITKYRERLGGFTNKEQLLEVYGFTPELMNHIAPHLSFDTADIRHIPINSVGLKELIKHPYVDYYFARDLINLRSHGQFFRGYKDLRAIPGASDSMLTKLLPYLDFSIPATQ